MREAGSKVHATGMHATGMQAADRTATVTGEAAAMHPAAHMATTTAMPTALRPHRYWKRQGKRRDGNQATHRIKL